MKYLFCNKHISFEDMRLRSPSGLIVYSTGILRVEVGLNKPLSGKEHKKLKISLVLIH